MPEGGHEAAARGALAIIAAVGARGRREHQPLGGTFTVIFTKSQEWERRYKRRRLHLDFFEGISDTGLFYCSLNQIERGEIRASPGSHLI